MSSCRSNESEPITTFVERHTIDRGRSVRPYWVVVDSLCGGVPDGSTTHKTRKAALAEYQRQLDAWVRRGAKLETIK